MTDTDLRPRASALFALRSAAIVGAIALALTGCSTAASVSTDDIIPDVADAGDTGGDAAGENDGEVTVIGEDLTSGTAALLAKVYAEGRDPIPTVEFLDATTVRFSWADGPDTIDVLGNCQIAYGALSGEGIRVLITAGSDELDCTAEVEG